MKQSRKRFYAPALLIILFLTSELLVKPLGEFPLNDDWSYTKSVLILLEEGRIHIGSWPAMTLCTNILWGGLFSSVFGFSFFILRLSTLVMAAAGILLMYALIFRFTKNTIASLTGACVLLFNPYFFNLSNTFMTDVSFLTLLLAGTYAVAAYAESKNIFWLPLILLLSMALVLLRQFGLIFSASFFVLSLIFVRKHRAGVLWSGIVLLLSCVTLYFYESYLQATMQPGIPYKYVFFPNSSGQDYKAIFLWNFDYRSSMILLQTLLYASPVAILWLLSAWTSVSLKQKITGIVLSLFICYWLRDITPFPGNLFTNMQLGAATFYQDLSPASSAGQHHNFSQTFETFAILFKYLLCFLSSLAGFLLLSEGLRKKRIFSNAPKLFICGMMLGYSVLLLVANSYMDRYHLPLIALAVILLSPAGPRWAQIYVPSTLIACFAYISIAGTIDYFRINQIRWDAYHYLTDDLQADHNTVQGGFETKCWDEGANTWWRSAETLEGQEFLIQYEPEPGFTAVKDFPFRRYFPFRKDTISIFKRSAAE